LRIAMALAALSLLLLPAPPARAQVVTRSGEQVSLAGPLQDMAFVAGREVRVSASSRHDIFAAGKRVAAEGAVADHLILAGGKVRAAPTSARALIMAGQWAALRNGAAVGDLVAVGERLALDPGARVDGSAMVSGGTVKVEAPIKGELHASGRDITLDGPVGGDAVLDGGHVLVGPNARIGGDLHLRGASLEVQPGAVVTGRTLREVVTPQPERGRFVFPLLFGLGAALLAAALAAVAPGLVADAAGRIRTRTLYALGLGVLVVLLWPICVGVLLATVLGAPFAVFLAAAFVAAIAPAFAAVAWLIGQALRTRLARARVAEPPRAAARFGWTFAGAVLLALVCFIPVLGALVWLAALVLGMGAVVGQGARSLRSGAPA
jgi:hypothetical protein